MSVPEGGDVRANKLPTTRIKNIAAPVAVGVGALGLALALTEEGQGEGEGQREEGEDLVSYPVCYVDESLNDKHLDDHHDF